MMKVDNSTGVLKKVLLCLPTYYELVPISEVAKRHIEAGEKVDHEVVEKEHAAMCECACPWFWKDVIVQTGCCNQ